MKLGLARGVALLTPALHKLQVYEYPANLIKKSVVGAGHAGKPQVQMMVRVLLPASQAGSPDAADALAVAICHAHHMGTLRQWGAKDFRRGSRGDRQAHRIIDSQTEDGLLIDVNGVGYVVLASSKTLARLGDKGTPASIFIETQVREDAITLFGFADAAEHDWFRLLRTVQGVGGKVALAILSTLTPQ